MTIEDFVIEQGTGENLQQVISGVLVKGPIEAIKELVSNSYDADAGIVKIEINKENKTIFVEDDGSGISEDGLNDFMRMGDSNKITNPISSKGRKRIGKFGIAKVLLEFLGDEYKLDTWCNKFHISGTERFGKNKTKGLEYTMEKSDRDKTGTSLLIKGIKSIGVKQFPIGSLKNALTWEVPNQEDFNIFLNGKKLIRENNKPEQKFYFKDTLPKAGEVNMEVQYFTTPPKISGTFIYVNKRVVGGSKEIDISKVGRKLINKLFVNINADGLQEHIAFNRAYIKEDNKTYIEVKKWAYEKLREIRSAVVSSESTPKKTTALLPIKVRMKKLLKDFTPLTSMGEISLESKKNKENLGFFRTHIIDNGISAPQAKVNSRTQELLINTGHPWYNSTETANSEVLKAHIILGTAFALGWEKYLQNSGSQSKMDEFYSLCAKLLSTEENIDEIKERVKETGMFVPFRRYNVADITREHISLACLHELADAGVLEIHNNTILGSELNNYMKKALDYMPAFEVVKSYELERINKQTGNLISRERVRQQYSSINDVLKKFQDKVPFIFDIGETKPFFLVRNEDVSRFLGLYTEGALKKGVNWSQHMDKYGELFDKLCGENGGRGRGFFGLESLCEIGRSSPHEVFKIVSYAQKTGIELPFEEKEGAIRYSVTHFKKAREEFLMGGKNV